jgi:hypothetical protein
LRAFAGALRAFAGPLRAFAGRLRGFDLVFRALALEVFFAAFVFFAALRLLDFRESFLAAISPLLAVPKNNWTVHNFGGSNS